MLLSVPLTSCLVALSWALPIPSVYKRQAGGFAVLDYANFQISDGVAGNAEAKAKAVFTDKFAGVDLATVSTDVTNNVETMRRAAEAAEDEFNNLIDAAGGTKSTDGVILQRGKIQNKVLKLTGELLVNQIKLAQGEDTSDKIAETQTKLANNIAQDVAEAGQPSKGVTGGSAATVASDTSATTSDDSTTSDDATTSDESTTTSDAPAVDAATGSFQLLDYAQFQISDGVAGNAKAEADAVFADKFAGIDLATVSTDDQNAVETMRQAAEAAETDGFNPAIDAAGGTKSTDGVVLQNGKIKNKVLKLSAELLVNQIKLAKGQDTQAKIDETQTKLNNNISLDQAAAGQASKGVTGGSATGSATAGSATAGSATSTSSADASTSTAATSTTSPATSVSSGSFQLLDYAQFQISDGVAGNAKAEADAVFADKFSGIDLATVSTDDQNAVETMRQAAEAAETDGFNPAIDAAGGTKSTDGVVLQNGKIKNKVLKLSAELLVNQIKLAKGQDTQAKIDETQTKLDNNISLDQAAAGQPSKGVV